MAVTDQQKLDFLLKKIGYTKTKTGSVVGTGAISGTPKQPFAEAIPSPLVVPNSSLWNEAASIPATAPGSDTTQVKVYLAGTSGLRMTADSTSSGQRAFIAYTTYNNTSSVRLTNWIDTQFGSSYLIKVYKGDPNSGGVALSAAGSGSNDGWFFDYSAGVLNFNDTSVPSGVTDTNIYIVGYRYVGQTGAPTSGISTFSYLDLTVERNLDVGIQGGISTFRNNIDLNADLDVDGHTNLDNVSIAGVSTFSDRVRVLDNQELQLGNAGDLKIKHDSASPNSSITNDTGFFRIANFASGQTMFIDAHTHQFRDQQSHLKAKFIENSAVELYHDGNLKFSTASSGINVVGTTTTGQLAVTGISTFTGNIDANGDLDVDGHTNLDNVSIAGFTTITQDLDVDGHTNLDNISVSGVSTFTGDATFAGNVSIGGTLTYEDVINVDSVGVITARAGIDCNADLDVDGHTNLDNVSVAGVTTFSDDVNFTSANSNNLLFDKSDNSLKFGDSVRAKFGASTDMEIYHTTASGGTNFIKGTGNLLLQSNVIVLEDQSGNDYIRIDNGSAVKIYHPGSTEKLRTTAQGIQVTGHSELDNVNIVGVTTTAGHILPQVDSAYDLGSSTHYWRNLYADNIVSTPGNGFIGPDLTVRNLKATGLSTFRDLDVDGHTNLDNVSIAGVTTFAGIIDGVAGENKIPFLYAGLTNLPNASDYHGMFAHVHSNGKAYYSHDMGSTITVTVGTDTVGGQSTGVFYFNGTEKPANFPLLRNTTYIFDQSHSTNASYGGAGAHPLMFSTGAGGDHNGNGHYMMGVTYKLDGVVKTMMQYTSGFVAATSRTVEWKVPANAPLTLYYWCHHHTGQGNSFSLSDGGWLELANKDKFGVVGAGTETYNIGILTATQLEVNGNADFSGITEVYHLNVLGIGTFAAPVDINSTLDVSGISTFNGNVDINSNVDISGTLDVHKDLDVDGHTNLDNVSIAGVVTATTFVGDGDFFHIDVDGHTDLDNVTVTGVSTFFEQVTINAPIDLNSDIDVDGHTNLDNVSVAGVTTFAANARFNNRIEVHDGTTGSNGQYLKSIGTGVTWASFPTMRTRDTITASAGQQTFHFNYTVNFIDVFVNGIKLTDSEFTATNGTAVVLSVGCFVGDIVELVSYNTVSQAGGGGGGGSLNNVVEDTSPQLGGNLDLFHKTITGTGGINITGVVTATTFVGDGSGLTGIVGSGAGGVVIKNSGSTVGTAGTIDFGDNLSVSPINAGIVTITGLSNFNNLSVSGLSTFTGNIDANGDLDVDGHTELDNVNISGLTTTALLNVTNLTAGRVTYAGASGRLVDSANLTFDGTSLFVSGINVVSGGTTSTFGPDVVTRNLKATGVSTFTGAITANGATFAGAIDANGDLDVDGHTNLDNVSIAGVVTATTLKGALQATSGSFSSTLDTVGINASGEINLDTHPARIKSSAGDLEIGVGTTSSFFITGGPYSAERFETTVDCCILYSAGTKVARTHNGRFEIGNPSATIGIGATFGVTGNALFGGTGIVTATKFVGDGSELTGVTAGISTSAGVVSIVNDLDVDGHTNLDNVTIAGVATFSSVVNAATFSGAANANNLNAGTVPSGRLSGTYNITNNGSAALIIPVNETSDTENFITFTNTATGSQTPKSNTSLKFNASSGALSATSFVGDGSGLSGVTAEGTGIAIKEDDNAVGTASTINFTEGISVTPVSSGITTVGIDTSQLNLGKLNVSGISTFNDQVSIESSINHIGDTGTSIGFPSNQVISFLTNGGTRLQIGPLGQIGAAGANYGTSGQVLTSSGTSGAVQWTTVNPNVGITTSLTGSFGSSPGNPTTINTYGYGTDDFVVEYTVYVYTGSSMQTQKVLASRIGTTINYTNYAIHFNSSLLIQCDVIRSGGDNFVLRATPESGVGGTINYRIKREVM